MLRRSCNEHTRGEKVLLRAKRTEPHLTPLNAAACMDTVQRCRANTGSVTCIARALKKDSGGSRHRSTHRASAESVTRIVCVVPFSKNDSGNIKRERWYPVEMERRTRTAEECICILHYTAARTTLLNASCKHGECSVHRTCGSIYSRIYHDSYIIYFVCC